MWKNRAALRAIVIEAALRRSGAIRQSRSRAGQVILTNSRQPTELPGSPQILGNDGAGDGSHQDLSIPRREQLVATTPERFPTTESR
jgi:hypothetical protein